MRPTRGIYGKKIANLTNRKPILRDRKVSRLDPFLNPSGIVCIGGRLRHSLDLSLGEKNTFLKPGQFNIE